MRGKRQLTTSSLGSIYCRNVLKENTNLRSDGNSQIAPGLQIVSKAEYSVLSNESMHLICFSAVFQAAVDAASRFIAVDVGGR
jgi:hypothetical protein